MVLLGERGPGNAITLEDCFVYTELDSSAWTAGKWMKTNDGILSGRNATNITLRNNYVLNVRFAINLASPDSLCEGNIINNFSGDGIRIMKDNITVRYNTVKNCFVSGEDGDSNHDDLIQCFLFNVGTGTVRNATVFGNLLLGNEDPARPLASSPQGLGFFDGPLLDFDVEQNVVKTNTYHGIALYDAVNCKIIDNAIMQSSPSKLKPWIMLGTKNKGGCRDNTVRNNTAHSFDFKTDPQADAGGNSLVDEAAFEKRLQELARIINEKFGGLHPVAGQPRLGFVKPATGSNNL
jgi:parallel beta-helix repeat protein